MTIPKITQAHYSEAWNLLAGETVSTHVDICNKAIEIALTEQQESEYITAEQARELGAGNAEYTCLGLDGWRICGYDCCYLNTKVYEYKYRAIKQAKSEPVDPHAALRAEYAQQVKDGTVGFYLWEVLEGTVWKKRESINNLYPNLQYRCTDISCYVALKGEPAKRMTRTEAQELQRQTDETHEWRLPNGSYRHEMYANGKLTFTDKGTYTYAPKATIKLDGKMVTPEQAAAEWEVKKETHDLLFNDSQTKDWKMPVGLVAWAAFDSREIEYELRPKALKQVSWSDMPVGVMTNRGTFLKSSHGFAQVLTTDNPYCVSDVADYELELAPASEQPWIALQEGEDFHDTARKFLAAGLFYTFHANRYKITGIAEGYVLEGAI